MVFYGWWGFLSFQDLGDQDLVWQVYRFFFYCGIFQKLECRIFLIGIEGSIVKGFELLSV